MRPVRLAKIACVATTLAVAIAVLVGWAVGDAQVTAAVPGKTAMNPLTAVCFILTATALAGSPRGATGLRRAWIIGVAMVLCTLGCLRLAAYATGSAFSLDQILFASRLGLGGVQPSRVAPNTALNFLAVGTALLSLVAGRTRWAQRAMSVVMLTSGIALLGYAYSETSLVRVASFIPMSLHTSALFVLVCVATWCSIPEVGMLGMLTRPGPGARVIRLLLPTFVVGAPLLGWLRLQGELAGLFTPSFGVAIMIAAMIVLGLLASWKIAHALDAAEAQRQRAETSFRALIEESPEGVLVHRDLRLVYLNRRALEDLGHTQVDDLLGQHMAVVVHADDLATVEVQARGLVETGTPLPQVEFRMQRVDGSAFVVEASSILVDFGGEQAVLTIARDCTHRRNLEARLILADRMASVGTLAAGIAHEINNPLAYVKLNLELVTEELAGTVPTPTVRAALADALEGADRVQKIVGGLKVFARSDAQERTAIDVSRALELALRITSNELRHRARVITDYAAMPAIFGDESRLGQVLINLLVNAVQALPQDAIARNEIRIATRTDELGRGVIEIGDNGCGMAPEVLKRVFDPFFTTKPVGEGTGLGLSICLGIVGSLGGTLTAESTLGVGSTFRVVLPASTGPVTKPTATATAPRAAAEASSSRPHVLIIDDDDQLRASLGRMLARSHHVVLARSGEEALVMLERGEVVDAIVSDLMMPGMTGMELRAQIARRFPRLVSKMIFMTGGAFTAEAREFVDTLGEAYLEKPFELAALRARLSVVTPDPEQVHKRRTAVPP